MSKKIRIWFDAKDDFLEVRFSEAAGYEKETQYQSVMERVDADGNVIGFRIKGVSRLDGAQPLVAELTAA